MKIPRVEAADERTVFRKIFPEEIRAINKHRKAPLSHSDKSCRGFVVRRV